MMPAKPQRRTVGTADYRVIGGPNDTEVPDDLFEAARVSRFMREGQNGRWRMRRFTVTEVDYQREIIRHRIESDHPEESIAREVPPGEYMSLQRRMTQHEKRAAFYESVGAFPEETVRTDPLLEGMDPDDLLERAFAVHGEDRAWMPVMSDTPAEILEHYHALNHATGRVLITGLGLGCLPHALLTRPDVTSIDIIEIDPEVIALTGHYLTDESPIVTIHQASALDIPDLFPRGTRFDYVWHDIWTHVSAKNLDDDSAEHGISYGRLENLTRDWLDVGLMDCWAKPMAEHMERVTQQEQAAEWLFIERVKAMPLDEAARAVADRMLWDSFPAGARDQFAPFPENHRLVLDPEDKAFAQAKRALGAPDFWEQYEARRSTRDERDYLDSPNAHLEVNHD